MSKSRIFNVALNVVLGLLILLAGYNLVQRYLRKPGTGSERKVTTVLRIGDTLSLPGVSWEKGHNVVLAIDTTCGACNDGVESYRRLRAHPQLADGRRLTVVSDEETEQVSNWLRTHAISVSRVVSIDSTLAEGLRVVPTILLVNGDGQITDHVAGRLDENTEQALFRRLEGGQQQVDTSLDVPTLDESQANASGALETSVILDIRPRTEFEVSHRKGAKNVPVDELAARLGEFESTKAILIDCTIAPLGRCRLAAEVFKRSGNSDVKILSAGPQ